MPEYSFIYVLTKPQDEIADNSVTIRTSKTRKPNKNFELYMQGKGSYSQRIP